MTTKEECATSVPGQTKQTEHVNGSDNAQTGGKVMRDTRSPPDRAATSTRSAREPSTCPLPLRTIMSALGRVCVPGTGVHGTTVTSAVRVVQPPAFRTKLADNLLRQYYLGYVLPAALVMSLIGVDE